jgi:hypothetical protein
MTLKLEKKGNYYNLSTGEGIILIINPSEEKLKELKEAGTIVAGMEAYFSELEIQRKVREEIFNSETIANPYFQRAKKEREEEETIREFFQW